MVIVVMGVSGAGKTTVGEALAAALPARFFDADDFHDPASIAKMRRGESLTDDDRAAWLARMRQLIETQAARPGDAVIACSALAAVHRRRLGLPHPGVTLVFLHGSEPLLRARLQARQGHFVGDQILTSQLALLEPPADALSFDVTPPVDALVREIRGALGR